MYFKLRRICKNFGVSPPKAQPFYWICSWVFCLVLVQPPRSVFSVDKDIPVILFVNQLFDFSFCFNM